MITSIAKLLRELMLKEAEELDQDPITHAPTIGDMYEGLTRDLLDRAIPPSLNLRIVHGFIEGHDGALSQQVDAMLVTGEGRELPFGAGHVWPIGKVIAVLEVKKNLFGADLRDAFTKLRSVMHMHEAHLRNMAEPLPEIRPAFHAFARLTGLYPRDWRAVQNLPDELSHIFRTLVSEQLAPVRIVIGYHGYANELSLREGLYKYLDDHHMAAGFGVISLPNLIICRGNALLKMNGQPYGGPIEGDWWHLAVSNAENPLRLLIELIWTRLSNEFGIALPMDDTLQMERLAPFLSVRFVRRGAEVGWEYRFNTLKSEQLAAVEPWTWAPDPADGNETVFLQILATRGEIDVRDAEYREFAAKEGFDPDALVAGLVKRRILAWCDEHTVRLIDGGTLITAVLPDGRVVHTSQADPLQLWLEEQSGVEAGPNKPEL